MEEVLCQSFKIDRYTDGTLKVTKPSSNNVKQGEIFIDGNGNIDISGYGTLYSCLLFALGMFALMCLAATLVVGVVAVAVCINNIHHRISIKIRRSTTRKTTRCSIATK